MTGTPSPWRARNGSPSTASCGLRRDALAEGYSDKAIAKLVRTHEWHRVRRGAYTSGELWDSLSPEDQHRVLCRAVLHDRASDALCSPTSPRRSSGVPRRGASTSTRSTSRGPTASVAARRRDWSTTADACSEDEVVILNGVRVTGAARSVAETCTIAGVEPSLTVANSLLHLGAIDMDATAANRSPSRDRGRGPSRPNWYAASLIAGSSPWPRLAPSTCSGASTSHAQSHRSRCTTSSGGSSGAWTLRGPEYGVFG